MVLSGREAREGGRRADTPLACVIGDLSLVRALGLSKIPVAVAASDLDEPATRSRYCRVTIPIASFVDAPERAVTALVGWARAQPAKPVLFYQGDHDLLALSRARTALEPHLRFLFPPADLVEDLVDKVRFAALAEKHSLPVPATHVVLQGRTARSALTQWSHYPCVLKPAMRTHWFDSPLVARASGMNQKAVRIENRAELERLAPLIEAHPGDFILQAAVEGGEERILSYHAYVRPGGHIVVEFTGKKVRTWPRRYGLSTCVEITDDARVKELGRAIVERLGFSGVLKMDFKVDERDERIYLLEINPRFSLWHHPATLAGACLPALYYRDAIEPGSARQRSAIRTGVRWMTVRGDVHALSQYRAADELSIGRWLLELAGTDVNEDFVLYDPWPGLVEMAGVAGRGLRRLFGDPAPEPAGGKA